MIIAIDFDGTCVTHDYPEVGKDIGAIPVLKKLIKNGHQLILWTMRSDTEILNGLTDAVNWFENNDISLYGIQRNPTQDTWTSSPKAYAQLYIDDAALGCPLKFDPYLSGRDFVDWEKVELLLIEKGIINDNKL
jgi:hypothetical protein